MDDRSTSPNDRLADQVLTALQKADLLKPGRSSHASKMLKASKVSASDWRLWAEDYAKEEVKDDSHTP